MNELEKAQIILSSEEVKKIIDKIIRDILLESEHLQEIILLGIQKKGVWFAKYLEEKLKEKTNKKIFCGSIDITFFRDDLRIKGHQIQTKEMFLPFPIDGKEVFLIDDVVMSGRTARAAMECLLSYGRPSKIKFVVFANRPKFRDLPIQPDISGISISIPKNERITLKFSSNKEIFLCKTTH